MLLQAQRLEKQQDSRSCYDVLGIPRSATSSQIKKGYHKSALEWHPDKHSDKGVEVHRTPPALRSRAPQRPDMFLVGDFQGQKVAEYRFKAVGEAYGILKDEAKKRRYDRGVPKHKCDDADSDYGYGGGGGFGGGGFGGGFGGGGFGGGWGEEDHYRQRARRGPYGRR